MDAPCPCGARDYRVVLDGVYDRAGASGYRFRVLRCRSCGLARTDPVPDVEQYARAELEAERSFAAGTTDAWSDSIAGFVASLSKPGRVLNVGAHSGNLHPPLEARGYEVVGIDIDPAAAEVARRAGRTVLVTDLLHAGFEPSSFEVVTLIHTLEHLEDPNAALREIARVLRPGGLLFINVPNRRGLLPRLMRDHWIGWVAHQHVWQFEPRTLEATVKRAGPFETVFLRAVGSMEPPSRGMKGAVKRAVAALGHRFGMGDQVVAAFRHAPPRGGGR